MELQNIRTNYKRSKLNKKDVPADPIEQFKTWFDEAVKAEVNEPNAMHLSTSTRLGVPSGRMVLLKDFSTDGFKFYTNYNSRKAKEILDNPNAALTFFWPELERQVRIEGAVRKTGEKDSDEYFNRRPEKSRISAIISPQSEEIPDRNYLEEKFAAFDKSKIERPDYWGGFLLTPSKIEFWQGREDRLHDRILFVKTESGWEIYRIAP